MLDFGLCVNPRFMPTNEELTEIRPSFLRSLLYSVSDVQVLLSANLPVLLTVNNECQEVGSDWEGWADALQAIVTAANGYAFGICVGNEFDAYWNVNEDDVPPSFAAGLVRIAYPILKAHKIATILPSVVSARWQEYLERMVGMCPGQFDYADLHAYGQRPDGFAQPGWGFGDLRTALTRARDIAGVPVIMSEYGVTPDSAGGEQNQAAYMTAAYQTVTNLGPSVCPMMSWFAYTDQVGKPDERGGGGFGLKREDGTLRPAWDRYAQITDAMWTDPVAVITPTTPDPTLPPEIIVWSYLWKAANPTLPYDEIIHGFGIPTYWRAHLTELGSPLSPEIADGDNRLQTFSLGIVKWTPDGTISRIA